MERVEIGTLVYLSPGEVYDFLVDFPRYADYSKYLKEVRSHGDGGPGTRYDLRFAWWKLGYTAHSKVTDVDPPNEISWELTEDVHAEGEWVVEEASDEAPPGRETASRVRLVVRYNPDSVDDGAVDLPLFVSLDRIVDRVAGLVIEEGERVVERIVADLEGERRDVELAVEVNGQPYYASERTE